jgi:hypothetical protein
MDNIPTGPLFCIYKGNQKYSVTPGTVNRIVPMIGSVFLDASTRPELTITATGYICIKLTHVAGTFFPRTATIVFVTGSTTPGDTETEGYYPLAKINVTGTGSSATYETIILSYGNLVCNRLKAGANTAIWYWGSISPQPGV